MTKSRAWLALAKHYQKIKDVHFRTLFAQDPARAEHFSLEAVGLCQRIIPEFESKAELELRHDNSTNTLIRRFRKMRGRSQFPA